MIFLHAQAFERLDVLHREHLEDVLVARTASRVAGAELARAEDREVDVGALQELGDRSARLLVAVVERARAADPVEVLVLERTEPASTIATPSRLSAQSPRSPWFIPYTFDEFSIERYVLPSSVGKSLSMSDR